MPLLALRFAAAAAVSLGVVACGPTASPTPSAHPHTATPGPTATPSPSAPFTPPGTPTPAPTNGTYSVTVAVSGTDSVRGSFTQAVDAGAGAHCPPPGQLSGTVSGQNVTLQLTGSPPPVSVPVLSPGDLLLTLGAHTWGVSSAANAPHGTTGNLQRNADGSGNAQFQNLALQSNFAQQPQESGSVSWSCA